MGSYNGEGVLRVRVFLARLLFFRHTLHAPIFHLIDLFY